MRYLKNILIMIKRSHILQLSVYILLLLLFSCKSTERLRNINFNTKYNPGAKTIHPEIKIYHHDNEYSTLYFRINSDELSYIRSSVDDHFKANFSLKYRVLPSYNSTELIDSASVNFVDSLNFESGNYISDSIIIYAPKGNDYKLHLVIRDHNKRTESPVLDNIYKSNDYSVQNFKIFDQDNSMLFYPYIEEASTIRLEYKYPESFTMNGLIFQQSLGLAKPPFLKSDETTELSSDATTAVKFESGIATVSIKEKGHYYFFNNNDTLQGFSLYFFHEGYPFIKTHESMLMPIKYLVSSADFEKLKANSDTRGAIDRFWVKMAGNPERARRLVSRYYKNVENSNIFFTSYKDGWKTDRGMIYTVFGPPDIVIISDEGETWHYEDSWQMMDLQFDFIQQEHKFTNNHYILIRKPAHRNPWYNGVENWRK